MSESFERESEMQYALGQLQQSGNSARIAPAVTGNREYNPGWHTTLDLKNLLTVSEAITRAAIGAKRKSRRTISRRLSREGRTFRESEHNHLESAGWLDANPIGAFAGNAGLFKTVIEEMK